MFSRLREKVAYWQRYCKRNVFVFGKGFTALRFVNFILIELQQRFFITRVIGRPYSIFVDPVNICILRCPLCGTGRGEIPRRRMLMSYKDFVRYVSPLTETLYKVKLYNYGEPFLNPELPQMIKYCYNNRIETQVNSNLNVMEPHFASEIVSAGLDQLVISFDGFSQKSYESYRRNGSVELVKQNIELINKEKQRQNSCTPVIVLQYLITRYNEEEYELINNYAKSINAVFFPQPITIDPTNPAHIEEWLPYNEQFTHYNRNLGIKKKARPERHCGFLWNDIVINVDGGVSPCCHLFYKETDFGNLNEKPFSKIWNNEKFRSARRIFRTQSIKETKTACDYCVDVRAFKDTGYDLINENKTNNIR